MLFILDHKQITVGVANNSNPDALPYWGDLHTENLEGISTYEFTVPAQHPDASKLTVNGHVIIRDLDGNNLLFTIKQTQEGHADGKQVKYIYCENTAIDELLGDVVRPVTLASSTLENTVQTIMNSSSGWTVGNVEYFASTDFEITDLTTVLEALRKVEAEYSVEIFFTVNLRGTQIVSKQVNVVKERGQETNVRFDYGYDLKGVTRNEDSSRVITALVLAGKGDTKGTRITLSTLPAFDEGDFFHLSNTDWIGSESALQRWSKDGNHIFGILIDDDADTQSRLKSKGIKELERRIVPELMYSCSITTLERLTGYEAKRLRLGDRIHVKDTTYEPPIAISGRVKMIKRSYTDNSKDEIDLGDYRPLTITTNHEIKRLQEKISMKEEKWNTSAYKVEIISSNGLIFKSGNVSTTLEARVYEGAEDITDTINSTYFLWKRKSDDLAGDEAWNTEHAGGTKSVQITSDDVRARATFTCEITGY